MYSVLYAGALLMIVTQTDDKKADGDAPAQAACEPAPEPPAEADDDLPPPPPPETDSTDPKPDIDSVTPDNRQDDPEENKDQLNEKGTRKSQLL